MAEYIRGKHLDLQNEQKNRYTFLGILQGVTCDGHITIREVQYLVAWLEQHEDGIGSIPQLNEINDLLVVMLIKQIIVDSDEIALKSLLNSISGNNWEKTNDTINMPINLYEKNPEIDLEYSCFVLTGSFEYGSKKDCEKLIRDLNGTCQDNVTANSSYLIVGKKGSKDWTHNSWGNKIEKAYRTEVPIISEEQWLEAVKNNKS